MKRFLLTLLLTSSALCVSWAQSAKDNKQKFVDAEYFFLNEDYEKAVKYYSELYASDTINYNVAYRIGVCYLNIPLKLFQSIPYLEKATKNVNLKYKEGSHKERKASPDAFYFLGKAYQMTHDFDKAVEKFQYYRNNLNTDDLYYLDLSERDILACGRAKELYAEPRTVEISNAGHDINAMYDDFNPCVSKNDSVMIFTRATIEKEKMYERKGQEEANIYDYKIMYSTKRPNNEWGRPVDITNVIKAGGTAQSISLSADGKTLFLYRDDYYYGTMKDVSGGNIYVSYFENGNWTAMKKFDEINSIAFDSHASISDDGKTIYFTSDRKGGLGGLDIYQIEKEENGKWSLPKNLGPGINSEYDEAAPFIVNDTMLYFCSQGHDNIGGFDVFFSKLNEDGNWSAPINMGVPINSPADEDFFVPVKSGTMGYFAVERPDGYLTFGHKDIYNVILVPKKLEPKTVDTLTNVLTGVLKVSDNNDIEKRVFVKLLEPKTKDLVTQSEINYTTGAFSVRAKPGDYIMQIDADHYESMTQNVYVPAEKMAAMAIETNLIHKQVASGEYFKIRAIFFDFSSLELNREATIELERLYSLMEKNPSLYIEVVGHTDSKGSESYNKKFSLRRAQSVIDYMAKKGIEASRFVSKGMGEEENIALNENPDGTDNIEGRRLNRRVEVRILRSDNKNIIVDEITVPDNLKFKDFIRYSILLSKDVTKRDTTAFADFYTKGLPHIFMKESNNQFVYYCGDYKTKADAIAALNKAIDLGFTTAELTDYFKINRMSELKVTKSNPKSRFTVQIRAQFKSCSIAETFKDLKDVKEYYCPDGYYRYVMGEFETRDAANKARETVSEAGYPGAFVVNAERFKENQMNQAGTTTKQAPNFAVQVLSSKKKVDIAKTFKELKGVTEKQCADGYYRYYYGDYKVYEEAIKVKNQLISKGYKDAFIANKNVN